VILSDYQLGEDMDTLDLIETMRARAQVFALLVATPTEAVLQRDADLGRGSGRKAPSRQLCRACCWPARRRESCDHGSR
jgi:hypothetical protein